MVSSSGQQLPCEGPSRECLSSSRSKKRLKIQLGEQSTGQSGRQWLDFALCYCTRASLAGRHQARNGLDQDGSLANNGIGECWNCHC